MFTKGEQQHEAQLAECSYDKFKEIEQSYATQFSKIWDLPQGQQNEYGLDNLKERYDLVREAYNEKGFSNYFGPLKTCDEMMAEFRLKKWASQRPVNEGNGIISFGLGLGRRGT